MKNKRPSAAGRTALVVLLAVLGAACVKQPPNGMGMKRVAADLVFGVSALQQVAAPPGAVPQPPEDFEEPPPVFAPTRPRPTPPAVQKCRDAGPNDFPQAAAPNTVTGRPKAGLYVWKMDGTQKPVGFPFRLSLPKFTDRSVEAVQSAAIDPASNFTFRTKEKDPSFGSQAIITRTFMVDQTNPSPQLKGIFLTKIETERQDGTKVTFEPAPPGVMYLPLQVRVGPAERFDSIGVDARNPAGRVALTHSGYVKERKRVDACGEVIDSWLVLGSQTFQVGTVASTYKYDYSIAPHFGGLIVYEHVDSPCSPGPEPDRACGPEPELKYHTNIGQTDPGKP